jgi:hypothetical protein
LNSGRRGGKPATNRLSYGAAKYHNLITRYEQNTLNIITSVITHLTISVKEKNLFKYVSANSI